MSDQVVGADELARPLIAQCRREIEAAWQQVEAARELLRASHGMFEQWQQQARGAAAEAPPLDNFRITPDHVWSARRRMFVSAEHIGRRRPRRARRKSLSRATPGRGPARIRRRSSQAK